MRKLALGLLLVAATAIAGDMPMPGQRAKFRPTQQTATFSVTIDGGGSAITTGIKADLTARQDCTVISWNMKADQSTTSVIDVWAVHCPGALAGASCAAYPATVTNTIAGSNKPTLTAATNAGSMVGATWLPKLMRGDALRFNVDSNNNATRIVVTFACQIP